MLNVFVVLERIENIVLLQSKQFKHMKKQFIILLLMSSAILFGFRQDSNLNDYVGKYKMDSFFETVTIEIKEEKLYATVDANGTYMLNALEEKDKYQSTSSYGTIFKFNRDAKTERVVGVTLTISDQEVSGKKEGN